MKKKIIVITSLAAAAVITAGALAGCGGDGLKDKAPTGSLIADFTEGAMPEALYASNGWTNGDVFNTQWSSDCVSFNDDGMRLFITENPDGAEETNNAYFSGEVRSHQLFGYGDYVVKMKPDKRDGTVSTFFSYTGPGDEEEGEDPAPHDEIDIEFPGNDTTRVQFNYFVNGVGNHEYLYDLGFDASVEYHEYGYRWSEDYIVWFVDGVPVYKVEASEGNPMPSHPSRIFLNYWCGTSATQGWIGNFVLSEDNGSEYQWVKCSATPVGEIPEQPEDVETSEIPQTGWVAIDYADFGGWSGYDIDKTDGLTISHSEAKNGWACEGMSLSQSYSWVKFTIKNNDTAAASVRLDIKQEGAGDGIGGVVGVYCESDGVVTVDSVSSAAAITLAGSQTADIVLKIKDIAVDQMIVFLNSMQESGGAATGSITITGLKGIVNDNAPYEPIDPSTGDAFSFTANESDFEADVYTVTDATNGINVTYSDIAGGSYKNISVATPTNASTHNVFYAKITNNGSETVKVRIDINSAQTVNNTTACNVSAKQDGVAVYTDTTYGGSTFTVAAGATVIVELTYDATRTPQNVIFFIDTSTNEDTASYSGDVTIFEMAFCTDPESEA